MANIGAPNISIIFKGLGASAVLRGKKGVAILIIKDDTDKTFDFAEYKSIEDLTSSEIAKYTAGNVQYIKDALTGIPLKLIVARMDIAGTLADLLIKIKGKAPRNCWISIAEGITTDQDALTTWVKSQVTNSKKRYKALVYNASVTDSMHVVNFTNTNVKWKDERGSVTAEKFISRLLGALAGLSMSQSAIALTFTDLESVTEEIDLDATVNAGELSLFNDEGQVKIVRGVNSLITTGDNITDDMKYIMIVEKMDLTYTDIYETFNNFYKGKYSNTADYQALLIGAINAYFEGLELDNVMDPNFDNKSSVDIIAQRLANIAKYGKETVDSWDDDKAKEMTYATNVFLTANVKYVNAMEDMSLNIYM